MTRLNLPSASGAKISKLQNREAVSLNNQPPFWSYPEPTKSHFVSINLGMWKKDMLWMPKDVLINKNFRSSSSETGDKDQIYVFLIITMS